MGNRGFLKGAFGGVGVGVVILLLLVGASVWNQGFLSQTSSATGGQQGAQNQAAQSSISFEGIIVRNGTILVTVRNVGAVPISIGGITVSGIPSNSGFKAEISASIPSSGPVSVVASDNSNWILTPHDGSFFQNISRGAFATLLLSGPISSAKSNDVLSVKITTTAGTFAQAQFTVP